MNLIGLAGSGELDNQSVASKTDNLGSTVGDLSNRLAAAYDGTGTSYTEHGVAYTAISVPAVLQGLNRNDPNYDPQRYYRSEEDGIRSLNTYLIGFINSRCPGAIVLAGYSQGAQAVMDVYDYLPASTRQRVAAVVLYGDPWFNPKAPVDQGTYIRQPSGYGILGSRVEPTDSDLPVGARFQDKAISFCLYKDVVCNSVDDPVTFIKDLRACLKPTCPHYAYPGSNWSAVGRAFVTKLLPPKPKAPLLDHLLVSPSSATISVGGSQAYTAAGFDASNAPIGDVTGSTTFTIAPDGSCTGAVCTANIPGVHTVTGTSTGGKVGSATLTVQPIASAGFTGVQTLENALSAVFAVKTDGTLWAWGLTPGATTESSVPLQIQGLSGVADISTDALSALAVKKDGTVWAWGYNDYGQLGNGTTSFSSIPVQVQGLTGVQSAIVADYSSCVALKSDGTVWTWGSNLSGQLGNGVNPSMSPLPSPVRGLTNVKSITTMGATTFALKSDGTVWAWGYNSSYGQLGNGTTISSSIPVQVQGLTGVQSIVSGYGAEYAVKADGTAWAWGYNFHGQLGNGTTTNALVPIQITGLSGVQLIAGSRSSSLTALMSDGTVWAWGSNDLGQLGNGTTTDALVPVQIPGLSGVKSVGNQSQSGFALKNDGSVWAWGYNFHGTLGNGTTTSSLVPVQTTGLSGVQAIVVDTDSEFAIMADGSVWAWGANSFGSLGIGTTTDSDIPVRVG